MWCRKERKIQGGGVTCGKGGGEGVWYVEMREVEIHQGHAMNTASSPW